MCRDGVRRGVGNVVGGDEEGVCWRIEDACFVEVRGAGIVDEKLKLGVGTEEGKKGVVVDEERLGLGVGRVGRGELVPCRCQL